MVNTSSNILNCSIMLVCSRPVTVDMCNFKCIQQSYLQKNFKILYINHFPQNITLTRAQFLQQIHIYEKNKN